MVEYVQPAGTPASLGALGYTGATWDRPWNLARGQVTALERMPSALLEPGPTVVWPRGPQLDLSSVAASDPLTDRATDVASLMRDRLDGDGLMVVQDGCIRAEMYANGFSDADHHLVHSCSKTLTTMMVGVAVDEGRLDLATPMQDLLEELRPVTAWDGVTVQHVLDMAVGTDTDEHYEDPESMYWRYADAVGYYEDTPTDRQSGTLDFVVAELTRRIDEPGARFNYASYVTNLLPIVVERAYGRPILDLYEESIYSRIGAESHAIVNVDSQGNPIVEGQISLTLRDFGRWAYPFVNEGRSVGGVQVVPAGWVDEAYRPDPARRMAFQRSDYGALMPGAEYHNQAWLLEPSQNLVMLGIHGQFAFMHRPSKLLIVGMSSFADQSNPLLFAIVSELWASIVSAVNA